MDQFMTLAERVGVPLVILFAFALAVWKVAVWFGVNVVMPITTSHIKLIDETVDASKRNSDILAKITEHNETRGNMNLKLTQEIHDVVVPKKPGG